MRSDSPLPHLVVQQSVHQLHILVLTGYAQRSLLLAILHIRLSSLLEQQLRTLVAIFPRLGGEEEGRVAICISGIHMDGTLAQQELHCEIIFTLDSEHERGAASEDRIIEVSTGLDESNTDRCPAPETGIVKSSVSVEVLRRGR
jgi:hypothetical protein